MNITTIESSALNLPFIEREKLFKKLLLSFEYPSKKEAEQLWLEEAKKRADIIDKGKIKMISGKQVEHKIRQYLNKNV